jgi:hypothetical protein
MIKSMGSSSGVAAAGLATDGPLQADAKMMEGGGAVVTPAASGSLEDGPPATTTTANATVAAAASAVAPAAAAAADVGVPEAAAAALTNTATMTVNVSFPFSFFGQWGFFSFLLFVFCFFSPVVVVV